MSIKAIEIVLESPILPPTNKLAAVVLANWCNDEGGSLYPSMQRIAERVGVSRSQAQRIVHGFVDLGLLSVISNAAGGKPGVTPNYQLHLDRIASLKTGTPRRPAGSTDATGRMDAMGRTDAQDGSHGCTGGVAPAHYTGCTDATQSVSYPSINRQESPRRERARRSKTGIPIDFGISMRVKAWAEDKAYANLEAHLEHFLDKARANDYRYADWDAAFMNAIRGDWARVRGKAAPYRNARFAGKNYHDGVNDDGTLL